MKTQQPAFEPTVHVSSILSLFDEQFSIADLSHAIESAENSSSGILETTKRAVYRAFEKDANSNNPKYIVNFDDETKAAIKCGNVELVPAKDGGFYAQLRNTENKQLSKKLSITEELGEEGIDTAALHTALQMEAIKKQLTTIIQSVQEIEEKVTEVIQGQRNDRLGLFYSGLSLYIEAKEIQDVSLKKQITAQALRSINDANAQMIQDIRTNIEYLITEEYKIHKKTTRKIEEYLNVIRQCYDVVYRAAFLKATIYQENGEIAAMLTAIDEYGRFIEKLIVPYAGKLSELDRHSQFIESGTWGEIAGTLSSCRELRKQIVENRVYLLSMGGIEDEG